MRRPTARRLLLLLVPIVLVVTGVVIYRYVSPEAQARRRGTSLYAPLIDYPESRQVERQLKATGADSCFLIWCEHYSLHVVYELPPSVGIEEVKAHYRSHLPTGWQEADDRACISTNAPPGATVRTDYEPRLPTNALLLENSRRQRRHHRHRAARAHHATRHLRLLSTSLSRGARFAALIRLDHRDRIGA
jgi:hypothetical protein